MPAPLIWAAGPFYSAPLIPIQALWRTVPVEGDRAIAANILWGTDDIDTAATPTGVVNFNLSNLSTQEFGQVVAIYVDNIHSGSDVVFIFPDTQFELTVPAGEEGLYPVLSRTRAFVVTASASLPGDRTYLQILNSLPPPIAISKTVFMSVATANSADLTATGATVIVPAGINGTMTGAVVIGIYIQGGAAGGLVEIVLADGNGNQLGTTAIGVDNTTAIVPMVVLFSISSVNVRFVNGINLNVTVSGTAPANGNANVTLYYREP